MKLQSQVSRKVGDTEYIKSWVVVPQEVLKQLDWKTGEELEVKAQNNKLVIEKV